MHHVSQPMLAVIFSVLTACTEAPTTAPYENLAAATAPAFTLSEHHTRWQVNVTAGGGTATSTRFAIQNRTSGAISVSFAITGTHAPSWALNLGAGTCTTNPFTLGPNASCNLGVDFTPTAVGRFKATLVVTGAGTTKKVGFSGLGT